MRSLSSECAADPTDDAWDQDLGCLRHPIGVFDSGVGGLSVLKALFTELPHEDFLYVADSAHAPYGERDEGFVVGRSLAVARHLFEHKHLRIQALVVACNTATAEAVATLRENYPHLPIIGVEPALKPAAAASHTQCVGVLATRATLGSRKFQTLMQSLRTQAHFVCQPCDGLASAIERDDTPQISALCTQYAGAVIQADPRVDTLVLGCTHYPFAVHHLRETVGPNVQLIDNSASIARQTRRMIREHAPSDRPGHIVLTSTDHGNLLAQAARRWLGMNPRVLNLAIPSHRHI